MNNRDLDRLIAMHIMDWYRLDKSTVVKLLNVHPEFELLSYSTTHTLCRVSLEELEQRRYYHSSRDTFNWYLNFPNYSTDIQDAWKAVNRITGSTQAVNFILKQAYDGIWFCEFEGFGDLTFKGSSTADTAETAICWAALKTKGIKV
jgi:hypothetical protein